MPSSTTKSRSGNPARRAESAEPADANASKYAPKAWGSQVNAPQDLRCPSGQLCLVRRPGLEGLMRAGILHNLDTLTPLIEKHREKVKGKKVKSSEVDVSEIMASPEKLEQVVHLMDRVTVHCVLQPEITMTPNDPTRREAGKIYADEIDFEDKMFILNYVVGGSSDLERFRVESGRALGGVFTGEEDEDTTE